MGTHISNRDIYFQSFTFNDSAVVELLLTHRYKYDDNLFLDYGDVSGATGAYSVNTEVIVTYVELDNLVKACNFSESELYIIKMLGLGYTVSEVAAIINVQQKNLNKKLKTLCKKVVNENLRKWRIWAYTEKLNLKTMKCSKCKNDLPATEEFFAPDYSKKTGFRGICKNCR